jgi:SNF family Na+-dependent transporter
MILSPGLRKLLLAIHIALAVGWIGAVAAYITLDLAAATSHDEQALRSAYLGMEQIVTWAIVPLAVAALITGLAVSLGTHWGLLRHWWVVISLLLTIVATLVLLVETRTITAMAAVAADPSTSVEDLRALGSTLVHSIGGTLVLLGVLILNVFKPPGLTPHGWRRQEEQRRRASP